MLYLIIVTIIWAFSFGLTKGNLAGVDPYFISFVRLAIALLIFLPFLRSRNVKIKTLFKLLAIGAVQFGIMYITLNFSYRYLQSYEVALLTITTPLFVTLIDDLLKKKFYWVFLATALAAVIGTGVIVFSSLTSSDALTGFILLQISNLSFAFGQVYYRQVMADEPELKDHQVFGWLYLGAVIITGVMSAIFTPWRNLQLGFTQIWTLVYLGAIASGVSFFLWNLGVRKVNTGALAVFNDLKVPFAVVVSLLVFGEKADGWRLLIGGVIVLAALGLNEYWVHRNRLAETGKLEG
jgi:carboxylate/amino acid/amine transporter